MQCSTVILTLVFALVIGECRSSAVSSQPQTFHPGFLGELITKSYNDIIKLGTDFHETFIRPKLDAVATALEEHSSAFLAKIQSFFDQTLFFNLEVFLKTLLRYLQDLKTRGPVIGQLWNDFRKILTKTTDDTSAQTSVIGSKMSEMLSKFVGGIGDRVNQLSPTTINNKAEQILITTMDDTSVQTPLIKDKISEIVSKFAPGIGDRAKQLKQARGKLI